MKYLAHKLQAWRRRRYLKRAAHAAGVSTVSRLSELDQTLIEDIALDRIG